MGLEMILDVMDGQETVETCDWQGATAIHGWFVLNVQDGMDGNRHEVQMEDIEQLVEDVTEVLESLGTPDFECVAEQLVPASSYGEDYLQDLTYTKTMLESIIEGHEVRYQYIYGASH